MAASSFRLQANSTDNYGGSLRGNEASGYVADNKAGTWREQSDVAREACNLQHWQGGVEWRSWRCAFASPSIHVVRVVSIGFSLKFHPRSEKFIILPSPY